MPSAAWFPIRLCFPIRPFAVISPSGPRSANMPVNMARLLPVLTRPLDTVVDNMFWYEAIIDGIPFPVHVTDVDMKRTFMNRAYEDLMIKNGVITDRVSACGMDCYTMALTFVRPKAAVSAVWLIRAWQIFTLNGLAATTNRIPPTSKIKRRKYWFCRNRHRFNADYPRQRLYPCRSKQIS